MIGFLKGRIITCEGSVVTLMVDNIGFEVMMPSEGIFLEGDEVEIFTYMHVRENEIGLYGFKRALDKQVFNLLIGVSGVGPKSAIQMLGELDSEILLRSIGNEDVKMLSTLPGVGKKTAARMILELKDKVHNQFALYMNEQESPAAPKSKQNKKANAIEKDLTDTLLALGYRSVEIEKLYASTDVCNKTNIDTALKLALQYLSRS